jgi:ketosteroid isomerase-like protein
VTGPADDAATVFAALLAAFERLDYDAVEALFAEDGAFDLPFRANEPRRIAGQAAVGAFVRASMGEFLAAIRFTVKRLYPCVDREWIVAEYASEGRTVTGGRYANAYVGLMQVHDGRILLFKEHYNPLVTVASRDEAGVPA